MFFLKRFFDVSATIIGMLLLWPCFALIAVMILLDDGPPVLFRQVRVGRNLVPFVILKFRSMRKGTADLATHQVSRSNVTRAGRFLRRSKLDELPQLWNVLKGDMSLVGPRPCLPFQSDVIEARRRRNATVLRPGLTGLAQVSGYDFSTPEETARLDAEYSARASVVLDLSLVLRTLLGQSKDNADAGMR